MSKHSINKLLEYVQNKDNIDIAYHHLDVKEGGIYVAVHTTVDKNIYFINEAINKGAKHIVTNHNLDLSNKEIFWYTSDNPRIALSRISSVLYPQKDSKIVAVTGTNGKTSVAYFYAQLVALLESAAASIGTLGLSKFKLSNTQDGKIIVSTTQLDHLTTPSPTMLHHAIYNLNNDGIKNVAIEASSHGLIQHRLDFIKCKAVAFTNFSDEHLDYHKNLSNYLQAKCKILTDIQHENVVLCADLPIYPKLLALCKKQNVITYGNTHSDLRLLPNKFGKLKFIFKNQIYNSKIRLVGNFQLHNLLCAIALITVVKPQYSMQHITSLLSYIQSPPGRMELIAYQKKARIYVDYAHTPEGLYNALKEIRALLHTGGKLHLVFGCGGNRDVEKRRCMGQIASTLADFVIITDDNPREEDPSFIRNEIMFHCPTAIEIADRNEAISRTILKLENEDILLVAGKGHENYQLIKGKKIFMSDKVTILDCIEKNTSEV